MDFNKLKCECGGSMNKIKTEWKGIEVRGWRCRNCNEETINPIDAQKALEIGILKNKKMMEAIKDSDKAKKKGIKTWSLKNS